MRRLAHGPLHLLRPRQPAPVGKVASWRSPETRDHPRLPRQLLRLRPPQGMAATEARRHSGGPLHGGAPHARPGPEKRGQRQDLEDHVPRSIGSPPVRSGGPRLHGHRSQPFVGGGLRAPRGALLPSGGERTPPAGCRSSPREAEGSLTLETQGKVVSSPDNDGTDRHCQTVRVRQARREGAREEPVS